MSQDIWKMLATVFEEIGKGKDFFPVSISTGFCHLSLFNLCSNILQLFASIFSFFSSFAYHVTYQAGCKIQWLLVYLQVEFSPPSNLSTFLAPIEGACVNLIVISLLSSPLGTTMSNPDISHKGNDAMCGVL